YPSACGWGRPVSSARCSSLRCFWCSSWSCSTAPSKPPSIASVSNATCSPGWRRTSAPPQSSFPSSCSALSGSWYCSDNAAQVTLFPRNGPQTGAPGAVNSPGPQTCIALLRRPMRRARLLLLCLMIPFAALEAQQAAQPTPDEQPRPQAVESDAAAQQALPSPPQEDAEPAQPPPLQNGGVQAAQVAQQAAAVEEDPDWAVTLERIANSVVSI